jgi:hypothetical protein
MSSAFFYRERRGIFVVVSLAVWFVFLIMFGPYLPANASPSSKQIIMSVQGSKVISHWIKENGRWKFQKISKILEINKSHHRRIASARSLSSAKAPATTASLPPAHSIKAKKRAVRAKLANEIGRWAKIGNRWEWRQSTAKSNPIKVSKEVEAKSRWIRRNGVWVFDVLVAQDLYMNI